MQKERKEGWVRIFMGRNVGKKNEESEERKRIEKIRRQKRKRSKRAKLKVLEYKRMQSEKKRERSYKPDYNDIF